MEGEEAERAEEAEVGRTDESQTVEAPTEMQEAEETPFTSTEGVSMDTQETATGIQQIQADSEDTDAAAASEITPVVTSVSSQAWAANGETQPSMGSPIDEEYLREVEETMAAVAGVDPEAGEPEQER